MAGPTRISTLDRITWINLSALLGTFRVYSIPGDVDFVDNGASPDTIVRQDGGSWVTDGFVTGQYVCVKNAASAANDFSAALTDVTASTLTVATGTVTAATGDATAEFTQVAYDPNGVMAGGTWESDPSGTTMEVQNATSVDGATEGAVIDELPLSVLRSFDPTTHDIRVYGKVVTSAPDNKAYWQALCAFENQTYASTGGIGLGCKRATTANQVYGQGIGSDAVGVNIAAAGVVGIIAFPEGGETARALGSGIATTAISSPSGSNYNSGRLVVVAGCENADDDGPHSAKILWRAAAVRRAP